MTMPQQGNYTSINWFNNTFYCYLNNEDIYQYNGELIGVSLNKYKQVEEALAKCKNRLIELGEIKIPKTPEEIIKEQSEIIDKQSKAFNEMMGMLTELKEKVEVNHEYTENKEPNKFYTPESKGENDRRINNSSGIDRPDRDTDKRPSNTSSTKAKK